MRDIKCLQQCSRVTSRVLKLINSCCACKKLNDGTSDLNVHLNGRNKEWISKLANQRKIKYTTSPQNIMNIMTIYGH